MAPVVDSGKGGDGIEFWNETVEMRMKMSVDWKMPESSDGAPKRK